jgi:hypothetical protein
MDLPCMLGGSTSTCRSDWTAGQQQLKVQSGGSSIRCAGIDVHQPCVWRQHMCGGPPCIRPLLPTPHTCSSSWPKCAWDLQLLAIDWEAECHLALLYRWCATPGRLASYSSSTMHLSSASTQSPHLARCSSADIPKAPVCIHFVADLCRQSTEFQAKFLHSVSSRACNMDKRLCHASCTPLQCIVTTAWATAVCVSVRCTRLKEHLTTSRPAHTQKTL